MPQGRWRGRAEMPPSPRETISAERPLHHASRGPPPPLRGGGKIKEAAMSEIGWFLDPQLAADTVPVCDLALTRLLAMNDANFPWLILVPRRAGVSEIIDLGAEQAVLMNELALVSRVLKDETRCDKLNVAAIGNIVPQLHIHVVARRKDDAAWPKPVWGALPRRAYEPGAMERFIAAIRRRVL